MDPPQGPPPPASLPPPLPPQTGAADPSVRTFTMLCHLSAFAGFVMPFLGAVVGPLIVWLIKKDEMPEVDAHGKESLNFQISILIYEIVFGLFSIFLIGLPFLFATWVFWLVAVIIASVRANAGEFFRYPLTIRFIN